MDDHRISGVRRSRRHLLTGSMVVVLLAAALAFVRSHPIWYADEPGVREWVLREVPRGSSMKQLEQVAESHGWKVNSTWQGDQPHADWGGVSGSTVAWVYLGGRRRVFRTDFDSFWAFDADGRLVDVKVRQMVDSL